MSYLKYHLKRHLKNHLKLLYLFKKLNRLFILFSNFIYPKRILESEKLLFSKIYLYCKNVFDVGSRFDVDFIEISKGNKIDYHLFEINPFFFEKLKKKLIPFNHTEKIYINNIGIGNRSGFKDYCEETQSLIARPFYEPKPVIKKLPIITLHSYLKKRKIRRIDFLKTDIEQYDYFALLGLKSYLKHIKFIQFELGLGAKLIFESHKKRFQYIGIKHYLNLLKKNFVLYFLQDKNNPLFQQLNLKNMDLFLFHEKDIRNIIKFTRTGIGFNIFAISKKINISLLGLKIFDDRLPSFKEFKYI